MGTTKRTRAVATDGQSTRTKTTRTQRSHVSKTGEEKVAATKKEKPFQETFSNETKVVMRQFAHQVVQAGVHTLRLKYAELKGFVPADPSKTQFEQNAAKCRYKDVPCWDKTRVVLTWPQGAQGDFIHANRVTHELLDNQQFICCQGPLDSTVPDFWRMVWQEKVRQVIMLCRTQEMGKDKCAQYWPNVVGNSISYHGLTVKCEKVDQSDRSFIHHKLVLTCGTDTRNIDHRLFFAWPDKSVPKTPMAPFRLLQFSRRNSKYPTIIHCSAGVGRTGTLVLIELMYKSLLRNKVPDVFQLVKDLRSQRSQAVQTEDQYLYCHYAILQLLHVKNAAPSHFIKHFVKEYENYLKLLNDVGGKNLPMQATTFPAACATCTKVVAHMNDPKPDQVASPPSDKKETERKESARESKREVKPALSVKESKRETKHSVKEVDNDKKATIMKKLKAQQKDDKTKRPTKDRRKSAEAAVDPATKPPESLPEGAPGPANTVVTQATVGEATVMPEEEKKEEPKKEVVANKPDEPTKKEVLEKKEEPVKKETEKKEEQTKKEPEKKEEVTKKEVEKKEEVTKKEHVTERVVPQSPRRTNLSKEPFHIPPTPSPVTQATQSPIPSSLPSAEPHNPPAPSPTLPPPQPVSAEKPEKPCAPPPAPSTTPTNATGNPPPTTTAPPTVPPVASQPTPNNATPTTTAAAATNKFQYKPATTYTIQQAGGKKAIIYHRSNQPFVKALATPAGVQQPQIMVNTTQPATPPPTSTPTQEKQQTQQQQPEKPSAPNN